MGPLHLASLLLVLLLPLVSAQNSNSDSGWGWSSVQVPAGSKIQYIPVRGNSATLLTLIDANYDPNKIERVTVITTGHGRDAWNYYGHMAAARGDAQSRLGVDPAKTLIVAPEFFSIGDLRNGAIPAGNPKKTLCYDGDWWSGGYDSLAECGTAGVSSFEAIDKLTDWLTDGRLPNLKFIMIAGHSLGGHFVHRYAHLGNPVARGREVHYWVGNPATYLYYSTDRPSTTNAMQSCPGYNKYMWGNAAMTSRITGYPTSDKNSFYNTYKSRNVHLSVGTLDAGSGIFGCEATVQGKSHYSRSTNYVNYLRQLCGGWPSRHTIDYFKAYHDARDMLTKKVTLQRFFTDSANAGLTTPSRVPAGLNNGVNSKFLRSDGRASPPVF